MLPRESTAIPDGVRTTRNIARDPDLKQDVSHRNRTSGTDYPSLCDVNIPTAIDGDARGSAASPC